MANIDITKPLLECLKQFKGAPLEGDKETRQKALEEDFVLLAKKLLYGGLFVISDNGQDLFNIELRSVEFYYHEEKDLPNRERIYDWIVYHKNTKNAIKKAYITGYLNAHVSGIDISFEDNTNPDDPIYRASALIRSYYVIKDGRKLEDHPTKIYDEILMQAPLRGYSIRWKDDDNKTDFSKDKLYSGRRVNVFQYKPYNDRNNTKTTELDPRKWAFSKDENTVVTHTDKNRKTTKEPPYTLIV